MRTVQPCSMTFGHALLSALRLASSFSARQTIIAPFGHLMLGRLLAPREAHPGRPVASIALRMVSPPSPARRRSPARKSPRRTAPPLYEPNVRRASFLSTAALALPSGAKYVT